MVKSITVLPGSGKQGRAAIKVFLDRGYTVHTLVRNPSSEISQQLQASGAIVHTGDLTDIQSIEASLQDTDALFFAIPAHPHNEILFAQNILTAARTANVQRIVYSSVARAGSHETFPGWNADTYPLASYWQNKQAIEDLVRASGASTHWTILRPAFFVQNFARPEVEYMFPGLVDKRRLSVAYTPETRLDLIDTQDIAKFAAAAFEQPGAFSGKEIPLASEQLTAMEIAEVLGTISGKTVDVQYISDEEASELVAKGFFAVLAQQWQRDVGYAVDLQEARQYGVTFTTMKKALERDTLGW
ncbi:NAD(P)-binding protein [Pyrenochaeta sp. DS3sAY3a]|nr:NAD(P)-binding protein [Pyrenochaeta sp. DS3sAY3a]